MTDKQKFDPSKRYTWAPTDEFILSGKDLGTILNSLRSFISTPEAAKILLAVEANDILEKVMHDAIESGVVKEVLEESLQEEDSLLN